MRTRPHLLVAKNAYGYFRSHSSFHKFYKIVSPVKPLVRLKLLYPKKFLFDKTSNILLLENNVKSFIIVKEKKEVVMETVFYERDKLLVFRITEEIDDYSVQKIRRKADYEIERYMPKRVVFDFDSVTFMDSAGIGLIIGRYKFVKMLGGNLELTNLTSSIKRIFEMSGILKLIPVTDSITK